MRPQRWAAITGATVRMLLYTPVRFVSSTSSHAASRELEDRRGDVHAGVGEEHVDPAEAVHRGGHGRGKRFAVSDVTLHGKRLATSRFDCRDRLVQICRGGQGIRRLLRVRASIAEDDIGARLGQPDGMRSPHAPGSSRDQGDPPLEIGHGVSFPVPRLVADATDLRAAARDTIVK